MISLHTYEMDQILRNPLLLTTARHLTLGYGSGMNKALDKFQMQLDAGQSNNAKGIFAFKGEKAELAVGWCLLTQEGDGMDFCPKEGFSCVQIFVDAGHRRQGIGSIMLKEASVLSVGRTIQCYQWGNPEFFNPFIKQGNFQSL